jgi:hypothetical protein
MNTAVPGTRTGLFFATSSRKRSIGSDPFDSSLRTILRPRFQVVIRVNSMTARRIGTQPPCNSLSAFALKKARSIIRKNPASDPALATLQFHCDRASR